MTHCLLILKSRSNCFRGWKSRWHIFWCSTNWREISLGRRTTGVQWLYKLGFWAAWWWWKWPVYIFIPDKGLLGHLSYEMARPMENLGEWLRLWTEIPARFVEIKHLRDQTLQYHPTGNCSVSGVLNIDMYNASDRNNCLWLSHLIFGKLKFWCKIGLWFKLFDKYNNCMILL